MKRLLSAVLAIALTFGMMPFAAYAQVDTKDQEFKDFLQEVGMTEEEFIAYLEEVHFDSIENFDSLEELKDYLGPLLNETNLEQIMEEYELTKEELEKVLEENGTSLDEYVFYDDLYYDLPEFLYADELTPITPENLQELLDLFGFKSKQELEKFLNEYDDSVENYEYIEDLYGAVGGLVFVQSKDELVNMLDSFGLSLAEANNIANHLLFVFENPSMDEDQFLSKMEEIGERLMNFPEYDHPEDLTAEDIAEFIDVWTDLLNLFDLKVEYYLVKDGKETAISLSSLMQLDSTNGADLVIKIFSKQGKFLADMKITKDMLGSDFLEETGKKIDQTKETAKEITKAVNKMPAKAPAKTVKGGKLPNTASDYLSKALMGVSLLLLGVFAFRKVRV
ncbi:processed acidic surface protein [Bacillus sp. REN3]|uniref:processed acidic surface protein n=1 Tax=Bacillus sp. REN3 TaxID=2802440 RepID=UPI001AEE65F6|nr:processed acidic surface protein [Bacillus sp. REN3]